MRFLILSLLIVLIGSVACQSGSPAADADGEKEMPILITSTAFSEGGNIPRRHTCDGEDLSPPLTWSGIPDGVQSIVLITDDPDAPIGTFVHWVLYNLPPDTRSLPEGDISLGTEGINDFGEMGFRGPCPPKGPAHRYYFKLYALDETLSLEPGATKGEVVKSMQNHILMEGQLMGKYGR